nr:hypothetical protein [Paucimonas lemoignei]
MKKRRLLATLSALAMSMPAVAADGHKGHDHDQKKGAAHVHDAKPLYGGIVTLVKDIHYELVAKPDSIALYMADHGKPVMAKDVDALVLLLSATNKKEVKLAPAGENKLEAKGNFDVAAGTKALASIVMPGKPVTNV